MEVGSQVRGNSNHPNGNDGGVDQDDIRKRIKGSDSPLW